VCTAGGVAEGGHACGLAKSPKQLKIREEITDAWKGGKGGSGCERGCSTRWRISSVPTADRRYNYGAWRVVGWKFGVQKRSAKTRPVWLARGILEASWNRETSGSWRAPVAQIASHAALGPR